MRDNSVDPILQWRTFAEQSTGKIVSGTGRYQRQRCIWIDRRWMDVEIFIELEKTFSGFAERSVATNNDDRLDPGSQRLARLPRRIPGRFCFVGLILNAGGVELFLNGGPQAPRTGGAVVDDNPCFNPRYLWLSLSAGTGATGCLR